MHNGVHGEGCQATSMRTVTMVFVLCGWGLACGASSSSSTDPQGKNGNGSDATNEPGSSGANTGNGEETNTGASPEALDVVFNEMAAVGSSEWIEIANKGTKPVALDGYFIADSDKSTGEPKKSDAMRFPAGTVLEPNGRILIVASKKNGTVGPHPKAECLVDGPDTCFYATFGLSATNGETVHFLAPNASVVTSTAIPKTLSADAGGNTSVSQCRVPDLTGDFASCAMTPGYPNRLE